MTIAEQSAYWINWLKTRKRSPAKLGTISTYSTYLNRWILPKAGNAEISTFGNAKMKVFIEDLSSSGRLGPKSVFEISSALKQIIGSAVDDNGDQIYRVVWNAEFTDTPIVDARKQRTPCASRAQVEQAVRPLGRYGVFYALLSGTGMRIGEALALRSRDDGKHTAWDDKNRCIHVRTAFWRGVEQSPKTAAGVRVIDIPESLNDCLASYCQDDGLMFTNDTGAGPMYRSTIQKFSLKKTGVKGFHAFRRFRITHLRENGVPEDLIRFWAGHAGQGITDRYSKLAANVGVRKLWASKVGLGFDIPGRENGCYSSEKEVGSPVVVLSGGEVSSGDILHEVSA